MAAVAMRAVSIAIRTHWRQGCEGVRSQGTRGGAGDELLECPHSSIPTGVLPQVYPCTQVPPRCPSARAPFSLHRTTWRRAPSRTLSTSPQPSWIPSTPMLRVDYALSTTTSLACWGRSPPSSAGWTSTLCSRRDSWGMRGTGREHVTRLHLTNMSQHPISIPLR